MSGVGAMVFSFDYNMDNKAFVRHFNAGRDTLFWDDDGRLERLVTRTTGNGYLQEGIAYDEAGRIFQLVKDEGFSTFYRNGLSHLTRSEQFVELGEMVDLYDRDGFGNDTIYHKYPPAIYPSGYGNTPGSRFRNVFPEFRGGRMSYSEQRWLVEAQNDSTPPSGWSPGIEDRSYDRGNHTGTWPEHNAWDYGHVNGPYATATRHTLNRSYARSYYGGDQMLRVYQVMRDSVDYRPSTPQAGQPYGTHEEYRYDALGRRVLKRGREEAPVCSHVNRCQSFVERYIWDGNQLLWEVRQPGDGDVDANFEIVGYVQAGELDAPLGLVKDAQPVILHRNWQGLFTFGTDLSGNHVTCQPGQTQQEDGCNEYSWPGIEWNTRNQFVDARKVQVWLGSLPKGQQDRTGLIYRRNRYYDSGSGQFTQADPIGIAGGVNLYGYANGDPVTFSDPFGLCPEEDQDSDGLCPGYLTVAQWNAVMDQTIDLYRLSERNPHNAEYGRFIMGTASGEGYPHPGLWGGAENLRTVGSPYDGGTGRRYNGDVPRQSPFGAVAFVHTHPFGSLRPSKEDRDNARIRGMPLFMANKNGVRVVLPNGILYDKTWPLGGR